jgi:hypothetical protein
MFKAISLRTWEVLFPASPINGPSRFCTRHEERYHKRHITGDKSEPYFFLKAKVSGKYLGT